MSDEKEDGCVMYYSDYNRFRGSLNQKSIPLKTTESRRGAAEEPQRATEVI